MLLHSSVYTPPVNEQGEEMPEYITTEEAATILNIDASTIRRWAERGKIPGALLIGKGPRATWAIPKESLDGLSRSNAGRPPKK